jgi:inosose dehydratase
LIKLAAAPISWGVCEVPGWGRMLATHRVLSEMRSLGLLATEFGAPGFLPEDPDELAVVLGEFDMSVLGGFVPLVLHDPAQAEATLVTAAATAERFARCGAELFVTAVVVDAGWSPRVELSAEQWRHVNAMFARLDEVISGHGLTQVLHPHAGTLVETLDDVRHVLDGSNVAWCLDTGHLALGGTDPVAFAAEAVDRVGLVHLKDVDLALAARYNSGEFSLMQAVQHGMFRSLGQGDVAIDQVVARLEAGAYQGWYVLEQDQAITGPEPEYGVGPIDDVRESVAYLRSRFEVSAAA